MIVPLGEVRDHNVDGHRQEFIFVKKIEMQHSFSLLAMTYYNRESNPLVLSHRIRLVQPLLMKVYGENIEVKWGSRGIVPGAKDLEDLSLAMIAD